MSSNNPYSRHPGEDNYRLPDAESNSSDSTPSDTPGPDPKVSDSGGSRTDYADAPTEVFPQRARNSGDDATAAHPRPSHGAGEDRSTRPTAQPAEGQDFTAETQVFNLPSGAASGAAGAGIGAAAGYGNAGSGSEASGYPASGQVGYDQPSQYGQPGQYGHPEYDSYGQYQQQPPAPPHGYQPMTGGYANQPPYGGRPQSPQPRQAARPPQPPAARAPQTVPTAPRNTSRGGSIAVPIIVLLVLLGLLIGGVVWWNNRPPSKEDSKTTQTTSSTSPKTTSSEDNQIRIPKPEIPEITIPSVEFPRGGNSDNSDQGGGDTNPVQPGRGNDSGNTGGDVELPDLNELQNQLNDLLGQ